MAAAGASALSVKTFRFAGSTLAPRRKFHGKLSVRRRAGGNARITDAAGTDDPMCDGSAGRNLG